MAPRVDPLEELLGERTDALWCRIRVVCVSREREPLEIQRVAWRMRHERCILSIGFAL